MDRNHTPAWPKVVEAEFARELELEIADLCQRQARELEGVASLFAEMSTFLGELPGDLGAARLNEVKVQLGERIHQLGGVEKTVKGPGIVAEVFEIKAVCQLFGKADFFGEVAAILSEKIAGQNAEGDNGRKDGPFPISGRESAAGHECRRYEAEAG